MDITLEAPPQTEATSFVDYARTSLDDIARAVALVIGEEPAATSALTISLVAARRDWHKPHVHDDPDHYVYCCAINDAIEERATTADTETAQPPLLGPACAVAYFGLNWTVDEISTGLHLNAEAVERHITAARTNGIAHHRDKPLTFDVRHQIRDLLSQQPTPAVDAKRIDRHYRWRLRRKTVLRAGLAIGLAIAALTLLAQLVARPDRVATEPSEPSPPPTPTSVSNTRDDTAGAAAGLIGNEPRPDLVPQPELIATDGNGGFVGVRSPSPQNSQAVFTQSADGQTWALQSRWNLGPGAAISRFERSGNFFLVWLQGVAQTSDDVIGTVGISQDLIGWTVIELAIDDPAPFGLIYDTEIASVSISGTNILALTKTTIEINFAALSLSEGYTCGQTINEDEVSVKLCNDAELDVLSLSGIETLPEPNRLFISRNSQPFEATAVPFDNRAAANLTTVNDLFAFTDEAGLRIATSSDALTWTTITAGKPPFPVRAAATNDRNEIVGVGLVANELALFSNDGRTASTTVRNLRELVDDVGPQTQALVASGPNTWVIYLYEPEGRAWLLNSDDGVDWQVDRWTPPAGDEPRLLVGDSGALVQWIDDAGETFTLGVPLG